MFKGTIIITDPCYITNAYDDIYDEITNHKFKNYIISNTVCGDWTCTTFKTDKKPEAEICSYLESGSDYDIDLPELGTFTADAGMVGVFLLKEVLKVNPTFNDFIKEYPHCVTVLEDFEGDVNIIRTLKNTVHVLGKSKDFNFFTIQTGL